VTALAADDVPDLLADALALDASQPFEAFGMQLDGGPNSDALVGGRRADILRGADGNDWLTGSNGNDRLEGGAGIDLAIFHGAWRIGSVQHDGSEYRVQSDLAAEGLDSLVGVERVHFEQGSVPWLALDLEGSAGSVVKIVGALFGAERVSESALIGIGLSLMDGGLTYPELVAAAVGSSLLAQQAGSHGNADFVNLVYRNLVGLAPTDAERGYYQGLLDTGAFTQASLAMLACDSALNLANVDLTGLVATGVAYLPG